MSISRARLEQIIREEVTDLLGERCQKGYKTHPKRKTKKMFGRRYRNCIKKEGLDKEGPLDEIYGITNQISSMLLPEEYKEIKDMIEPMLDKIRDLADPMELDEVASSERQRRWACAQMGDNFKGERSLSPTEAEKMCKDPVKPTKKGKK